MVGVKKESEEEEDGELEQAQIKKAAICIEHTVRTVDQNLKGIHMYYYVISCVFMYVWMGVYITAMWVSVCVYISAYSTSARVLWLQQARELKHNISLKMPHYFPPLCVLCVCVSEGPVEDVC